MSDKRVAASLTELFEQAVVLAPEERNRFLQDAAGHEDMLDEVRQLIAATERCCISDSVRAALDHAFTHCSQERIGAYKRVRLLGRGGMGTVYLAERADDQFSKQVAIKVLDGVFAGPHHISRFRTERQILATLEHPNIARLLDGGVTDEGLQFLVMEYVHGEPIDRYCEARGLGLKQKLDLFCHICDAVAFAHRNLVIHRDLKPDNILVDDAGTPKLLDFGIAKLVESDLSAQQTLTSERLFTPEYASPEQLSGQAMSTATDVYSLGVVLHELVTGKRPFALAGKPPLEVLRIVSTQELPRARASNTPYDLDCIIRKCLRKQPGERYVSVSALVHDIRAMLSGYPVRARRGTWRYRATRYVHRNFRWILVSTAVLLVAATGVWSTQRESRVSAAHFEQARRLAGSVIFEAYDSITELPNANRARRLLITRSLEYLQELADTPDKSAGVKRELALAYGRVRDLQFRSGHSHLGDLPGALASALRAKDLWDEIPGAEQERVEARQRLAALLIESGGPKAAARQVNEAARLLKECKLQPVEQWAEQHDLESRFLLDRGRTAEAIRVAQQAVREWEQLLHSSGASTSVLLGLSKDLQLLGDEFGSDWAVSAGDDRAAKAAYLRAIAVSERLFQSNPESVSAVANLYKPTIALAGLYIAMKRPLEASRTVERCTRLLTAAHMRDTGNNEIARDLAQSFRMAGIASEKLKNFPAAEKAFRNEYRLVQEFGEAAGNKSHAFSVASGDVCWILFRERRYREASSYCQAEFDSTLALYRQHPDDGGTGNNLMGVYEVRGMLQLALGNKAGALSAFEEALRVAKLVQAEHGRERNKVSEIQRLNQHISAVKYGTHDPYPWD